MRNVESRLRAAVSAACLATIALAFSFSTPTEMTARSGTTLTSDVPVTVRDISKLDSLLEALVKAGGNRIDSIQYETSELRKYRDQAREMAVIAAKEKAQALASALGQHIGKAYTIEEPLDVSSLQAANSYFYNSSADKRGRESATAPGERSVTAAITIAFELI